MFSDIGILASHEEGMSNALLNICCSLPVVATDVGGNHETLGETGLLVPAASPDLMASALAELCNDPGKPDQLANGRVAV